MEDPKIHAIAQSLRRNAFENFKIGLLYRLMEER